MKCWKPGMSLYKVIEQACLDAFVYYGSVKKAADALKSSEKTVKDFLKKVTIECRGCNKRLGPDDTVRRGLCRICRDPSIA